MNNRSILQRFLFSLSVLTLLFLGACQDDPVTSTPVGGTTVDGIVSDENGLIVPYAVVEAISPSNAILAVDTSDENGAFALASLPDDLQGTMLRITHGELLSVEMPITAAVDDAGGRTGVVLRMRHSDECCARLIVKVVNSNGTGVVAGAEVKLRRGDRLVTMTRTNDEGYATFANLCRGEFNIRAAKTGFAAAERGGINVTGCDTIRVELGMRVTSTDTPRDTCCGGVLRVTTLDSATGANLSGATIKITKAGGDSRIVTTTGDVTTIRELCAGQYNLRISKEGTPKYRVVEFSVTMACNDTQSVSRTLATLPAPAPDTCCGGRVTILTRDSATGANISGATVQIKKGGTLVRSGTSGDRGITFNELCRGEYYVRIVRDGYRVTEYEFTLGCNQTLELTRRMLAESTSGDCCRGMAVVVLRDSTTNTVIANGTVKLWRGSTLVRTGTTNADGVARFVELCEGDYQFTLIREGYKSREVNFHLGCNDTIDRSIRLLRNTTADTCCNAVLKVKVKDSTVAEGGWLSGVTVTIRKGDQTIATGETNVEGRYGREAICGFSTYTVTFSKPGYRSKTVSFTYEACRILEETIRLVPE